MEKCPLAKEEQNLENLYNIISEYLDDRWFESKLDLLNCTISLIFTAEKNFKPYANSCLFKVLDYLTDEEWMKRKLAINIVYTLLFYCKEEILPEKDNIIDFLSVLKDDPVNEVKEVCLQTLNFIKEIAPEEESDDEFKINNDNDNDDNDNNNDNNDNLPKTKNAKNVKPNNNKMKIKKGKYNNIKKINKENQNRNQEQNQSENINDNYENNDNENQQFNDKINLSFYNISQELKKIQEEQNELYAMYDEVKQIIEKNYSSLNDRLKVIENKFPNYSIKNIHKKK